MGAKVITRSNRQYFWDHLVVTPLGRRHMSISADPNFEDDDEFEEFENQDDWDKEEEEKEALQQWEDDWDDDDVNDDFSLQLRKELEKKSDE